MPARKVPGGTFPGRCRQRNAVERGTEPSMAQQETTTSGPDLAGGIPRNAVADGGMLLGHVGEETVLLVRQAGAFFAVGAKCTHYGGPLGDGVVAAGDTVRCPWHHACFSLRTGEAVRAPAIDPIPRWRTETIGDLVFVRERLPAVTSSVAPRNAGAGGRPALVIVGGGAAGFAAAEKLRRDGFDGDVVMFSAEADPPVDRPNLSKDFLAGKAPVDWAFVRPASFYADQRIDLRLKTRVVRLDPRGKRLTLANGQTVAFDKLLLATGTEPVRLTIPGADLPHVFTLRSLADSQAIIARAGDSGVAVVIGASFIGLEVAASLVARGLTVHVVAP